MCWFHLLKFIWDFYHQKFTPSTKPSQPVKLQMSKRNHIQPTRIELCWHKNSNHTKRIKLCSMYQEHYSKHTRLHPNEKVSCGTFFGLKPSYITTETKKNMEMCSYKLHLHARWAIEGILKNAEQQKIKVPFSNPHFFFEKLTQQHISLPPPILTGDVHQIKKTFVIILNRTAMTYLKSWSIHQLILYVSHAELSWWLSM